MTTAKDKRAARRAAAAAAAAAQVPAPAETPEPVNPDAPANTDLTASATPSSEAPADKPANAPTKGQGRDPHRTHMASHAPDLYGGKGFVAAGRKSPQQALPRAGTKTDLCLLAMLGQQRDADGVAVDCPDYANGVTVAQFAAILAGFGPASRHDAAYARTWPQPSYVRDRWGMGMVARQDQDGLVRCYGVRLLSSGRVLAHRALTVQDIAALGGPVATVVADQDGAFMVPVQAPEQDGAAAG